MTRTSGCSVDTVSWARLCSSSAMQVIASEYSLAPSGASPNRSACFMCSHAAIGWRMLTRHSARLKRIFGWSHVASAFSYWTTASVYFDCSNSSLPGWKILSARFCFSAETPCAHGLSSPSACATPTPAPAIPPTSTAHTANAAIPSLMRRTVTRRVGALFVDQVRAMQHRMIQLAAAGRAVDVERQAHQGVGPGLEVMRAHRLEDAGHPGQELALDRLLAYTDHTGPAAAQDEHDARRRVDVVDLLGGVGRHVEQLQRRIARALRREHLLGGATIDVGQRRALPDRRAAVLGHVAADHGRQVSTLDHTRAAPQMCNLAIIGERVRAVTELDRDGVLTQVGTVEIQVRRAGLGDGGTPAGEVPNPVDLGQTVLRRDLVGTAQRDQRHRVPSFREIVGVSTAVSSW